MLWLDDNCVAGRVGVLFRFICLKLEEIYVKRTNLSSANSLNRRNNIMLETGVKAPDFTLADKDGNEVALSGFLGKKVVLYFYPKDNTPGCTRQACAFAKSYEDFKSRDVVVIGVSKDSDYSIDADYDLVSVGVKYTF